MSVRRYAATLGLLSGLIAASLTHGAHAQSAQNSPRHNHVASRHTHRVTKAAATHAAAETASPHGHRLITAARGKKSYIHRASAHVAQHVIQCVPYARAVSGIALRGNAAVWWDEAAGIYERGNRPEVGAVLAFRANRAMRLGHVAVVSRVINSREIEIDHAHWGSNGISRNIAVIDVSPNNDWTLVRVALGRNGTFGSVYATHGFIYDRAPGSGGAAAETVTAEAKMPAPIPSPAAGETQGAEIAAAPPAEPLSPEIEAPLRSFR